MSATQYSGLLFAPINVSGTGTLIAAVAKKSIVVVHVAFSIGSTSGGGAIAFRSGGATLLTGAMTGGLATAPTAYDLAGDRNQPLFSTANGATLDVVVSGAGCSVQGMMTYFLEDAQ